MSALLRLELLVTAAAFPGPHETSGRSKAPRCHQHRLLRWTCGDGEAGASVVALAVILTTVTCFAQGQVNFANRVGAGGSILNAPVTIEGYVSQYGPGSDWTAQLLLQNADGLLTPFCPSRRSTQLARVLRQFPVSSGLQRL